MFNNIFGMFSKDVNVNQDEIFNIASKASDMDLQNEQQVRALISSVSAMVGKKVDPKVEEQLTKMILNGEVPKDMNELLKMMM
ncbi:MAG: stage VI sporulation protein F [Turicibacter sp.]